MQYLHYDLHLGPNDVVEVTLDRQANVRLLDDHNFAEYRQGRAHRFHGGLAKQSPVRLQPPCSGRWHVAIDLGGYRGQVKAAVRTINC